MCLVVFIFTLFITTEKKLYTLSWWCHWTTHTQTDHTHTCIARINIAQYMMLHSHHSQYSHNAIQTIAASKYTIIACGQPRVTFHNEMKRLTTDSYCIFTQL